MTSQECSYFRVQKKFWTNTLGGPTVSPADLKLSSCGPADEVVPNLASHRLGGSSI